MAPVIGPAAAPVFVVEGIEEIPNEPVDAEASAKPVVLPPQLLHVPAGDPGPEAPAPPKIVQRYETHQAHETHVTLTRTEATLRAADGAPVAASSRAKEQSLNEPVPQVEAVDKSPAPAVTVREAEEPIRVQPQQRAFTTTRNVETKLQEVVIERSVDLAVRASAAALEEREPVRSEVAALEPAHLIEIESAPIVPAPVESAPPNVEVRIGRIEIIQAAPPPSPAPRPRREPRGFAEHRLDRAYLNRRWY
jgi:hypothetical protein